MELSGSGSEWEWREGVEVRGGEWEWMVCVEVEVSGSGGCVYVWEWRVCVWEERLLSLCPLSLPSSLPLSLPLQATQHAGPATE